MKSVTVNVYQFSVRQKAYILHTTVQVAVTKETPKRIHAGGYIYDRATGEQILNSVQRNGWFRRSIKTP